LVREFQRFTSKKSVFRLMDGVNWLSHSGATAWSASGSTDGARLT
jgi:hypothetical protein